MEKKEEKKEMREIEINGIKVKIKDEELIKILLERVIICNRDFKIVAKIEGIGEYEIDYFLAQEIITTARGEEGLEHEEVMKLWGL